MPVGMQETQPTQLPCHFPIPGLPGSRTNDHLSACSEIWCICCHKRRPSPQLAPLSLLVAGQPFVGPWHVVWIMVMVLRLPHPVAVWVSFITFWLFDRLLSVVSVSALISVSCNYSLSGKVATLEENWK